MQARNTISVDHVRSSKGTGNITTGPATGSLTFKEKNSNVTLNESNVQMYDEELKGQCPSPGQGSIGVHDMSSID